ncbi:hypothetical protein D3C71_1829900 [compost metagenome]
MKDGDVEELYQTIRRVYDRNVNHQELSIEGYSNVMNDFNMKTIARKVEHTYHLLLGRPLKSEVAG